MIDPEVQKYVQGEIEKSREKSRFNTGNATYHVHNGIDSPILPTLAYIRLGVGTSAVLGAQPIIAPQGTLYINIGTSATATTRLFINKNGGDSWASFTASS